MKTAGFDIFCTKSAKAAKSALSESGSIDIREMSMRWPACRNMDVAEYIIWFPFQPSTCSSESLLFSKEQADLGVRSARSQGLGSDGASGHGQHPWQISCQADSHSAHWTQRARHYRGGKTEREPKPEKITNRNTVCNMEWNISPQIENVFFLTQFRNRILKLFYFLLKI